MKDKRCIECHVKIKKAHPNRKRCESCVLLLRNKPKGTMTPSQIKSAKKLAGTMPREEIAKTLGVSLTNLKRSCTGTKFYFFNRYANNPELVNKVCAYYEKNGKKKTQETFPDINVRCLIERYKNFSPRQTKWRDEEIIEAVKMAGLISFTGQQLYFHRPNAHEGSIRSLWMKRFRFGQGKINGLRGHRGLPLVTDRCKPITIWFGDTRDRSKWESKIYLWVDLEKHLKPEVHPDIKQAIKSMAQFQKWLWNSKNPKPKILKMIKEREV